MANTPEERVRQALIQKMIGDWGFPRGLISIEQGIGPRRYDLLCYTQEMTPLVLFECKAHKLSEEAIKQALGYNDEVKAPFVCLCAASEIRTFWHEKGALKSVPFLPPYKELYELARRL